MKTITRFCLTLSLSALVSLAHAANPGIYAGLGLGANRLETPNSYLFDTTDSAGQNIGSTSRSLGGLGGRAFTGYNFNQYFGIEGGYARYARSEYKATLNNGQNSSIEYNMSTLDAVGKAYLPINNSGFNVYGLGGLAYVRNTTKYNNGGVNLVNGVTAPANGSKMHSKIRPVVGVGVSFDVSQSLSTHLELSHIQGSGNVKTSSNAIPSADMITLNFSYNFG